MCDAARSDREAVVYTAGYSAWEPEQLFSVARSLEAVIVDVRLSPRSRDPRWRLSKLAAMGGDDYLWVPELGNTNYREEDAPVRLSNVEDGVEKVRAVVEKGRSPVLLCACRRHVGCHRTDAAAAVAEALGMKVKHLYPQSSRSGGGSDDGERPEKRAETIAQLLLFGAGLIS